MVQLQILKTYRSLRVVPQISAAMATLDKDGKALPCTLCLLAPENGKKPNFLHRIIERN